MRDKEELYHEYIKTYNSGKELTKLISSDETFQALKMKQGLPVKYISTKDIMSLPVDSQLIGADGFYRRQKGFYLIPNDFNNKIISFVIRGLTHDYYDTFGMSKIRPLFGWYTFKDFKKDRPIIITEGSKDCIVLQKYYPYTLALLTSGITMQNMNILKSMTSKLILAYDSDTVGKKATQDDIKKLQDKGIQVQFLRPNKKDFGAEYESTDLGLRIKKVISKFSILGGILCKN